VETLSSTDKHANMGPIYGGLIFGAWLAIHLYSLFFHNLSAPIWQTIGLIAFQCWLYTGLFIVAHDTMHGSFAPGKERLNAIVGTAILFVYAGFNWSAMRTAHHAHHEFPGTEHDPDFNANDPLGASYVNTIVMWAVPAILSSVQLFYFGTYLTHRHADAFPDHHNARTNEFNWLASLLSCFHFGYHHEHHLFPHEPWWRLPKRKKELGS